ncbi:glycosyltransferase family 4 protein [Allosphingosinicella deserti]|uniref:glycosyltransferase family 4 protein n=1 Tax=Allosphingosinicella deserti TaxID=2116704 RepID=UPI001304F21E|nr:glycosyltransferase family 4 protein [Sphingomonas deserti]
MSPPAPDRSLRLLSVTHFFGAHGGGIERVAEHLNREFTRLGHAPSWAASDADPAPDPSIADAVPMRCIDPLERLTGLPMPLPGPRALRSLWRAVREADGIIIHDSLYVTSIAAMMAARWVGKPVVLVQHIAEIPFRSPVLRAAMRIANTIVTRSMLRSADRVVFISATVRDAFRRWKTRRSPELIFNGVDRAVFRPDPDAGARARSALGLATGDRLMLFVGRFVEKKGLPVLAALAQTRPDLLFVLAGRGPIDPDAWGLPNVRVVRDRAGPSLAALYQAADLLLLPSIGEGYPLVVQEAMACGLPVLCGVESAKADPEAARWLTGLEVAPGDPPGTAHRFSDAIDAGSCDPDARAAMACWAGARYSWEHAARSIVALIAGNLTRS